METIGDYIEEMRGTELGALLEREVARASRIRGGRDFRNIGVKSVGEMGEAAGTFHTGSKEVHIRKDVVSTRRGIQKLVAKVLVHEDIHKGNEKVGDSENHSEGVVDWRTRRALRVHDSIYEKEVQQIETIAAEIGDERVEELGKKPGAEVLLFADYVRSRVAKGANLKQAAQQGAELIKKAA